MERRIGTTTRLVDSIIQHLFSGIPIIIATEEMIVNQEYKGYPYNTLFVLEDYIVPREKIHLFHTSYAFKEKQFHTKKILHTRLVREHNMKLDFNCSMIIHTKSNSSFEPISIYNIATMDKKFEDVYKPKNFISNILDKLIQYSIKLYKKYNV